MAVNQTGRLTFIEAGTIRKFLGGHNRERTMKRFAFAIGVATLVATLGFAAITPAWADYALVRWDNGDCRIWWEASATPWGASWTKVAMAPDYPTVATALDQAVHNGTCR
jgi:hypothetical protein